MRRQDRRKACMVKVKKEKKREARKRGEEAGWQGRRWVGCDWTKQQSIVT